MWKPGARRVRRNVIIAACVAAAGFGLAAVVGLQDPLFAASLATAYVGLALLALTLLPGPVNVVRRRPNPVSTHLRRDLGIWAGVVSLAHVAVGLQRHMRGRWWLYFTFPDGGGRLLGLRYDPFGVANWAGLAATAIVVLLLVISNDLSLRRLGNARWKRIQRWNYALFGLTVLHGLVYQVVIGDRAPGWIVASLLTVAGVAVFQALGWRRRVGGDGEPRRSPDRAQARDSDRASA